MANAMITQSARIKMVKARAGVATLPKIAGMAFGDGGAQADGTPIEIPDTQSELHNELLRKEVDGHEFLADTKCRYTCTLTENELVGKMISEIGLYDEEGDLVAIKNFIPKGKDNDIEMSFHVDDEF